MGTKTISLVLSILILTVIIEMVRREKLNFKYAVAWIFMSLAAIFFTLFDTALFRIAYWLGFELPSNFVFFTLLGFFVFLSLLLTAFIYRQDCRNDIMAQKISILELEIDQLKDRLEEKKEKR